MKKLITVLLLCAICLSAFVSCDNDTKEPTADSTDTAALTDAVEEETPKNETSAPAGVNAATLYTFDEDEKPLENLVTDGGLCAIFQTVAVVGDSLSIGIIDQDPSLSGQYPDTEPYSWPSYMARDCGFKVHNFSRGGMTAHEYVTSWADQGYNQFYNGRYRAQAYIIALSANDLSVDQPIGTVADINHKDYTKNANSFVGDYAKIIQRYKEVSPDAFFFLVTFPNYESDKSPDARRAQREAIYAISEEFEQAYVIDLYEYAPVVDDEFKERYHLRGHMSPMGYRYAAVLIESYIDWHIRKNPEAFAEVGFINTDFYSLGDKAK